MAEKFEAFLKSDSRFEIPAERHLGMVVFRLKVSLMVVSFKHTQIISYSKESLLQINLHTSIKVLDLR